MLKPEGIAAHPEVNAVIKEGKMLDGERAKEIARDMIAYMPRAVAVQSVVRAVEELYRSLETMAEATVRDEIVMADPPSFLTPDHEIAHRAPRIMRRLVEERKLTMLPAREGGDGRAGGARDARAPGSAAVRLPATTCRAGRRSHVPRLDTGRRPTSSTSWRRRPRSSRRTSRSLSPRSPPSHSGVGPARGSPGSAPERKSQKTLSRLTERKPRTG